jgi:crotonobetainyl-CoA:carnitine CoA-transferase CaiB-like acyl-CoA transferase
VFKTTAEWISLLEQAGVPCGPINNLAQVFEDEQVKARGLRLDLPHALGCLAPQVASPIRLSATPVEYRHAPPLLGQHTEQVLQSLLGMTAGQIAELRGAGVL